MSCPAHQHDRRRFLGLLAVGLAATVTGCADEREQHGQASASPPPNSPAGNPALPPIPRAHPGPATVLSRGTQAGNRICLTVDDGFCADCVRGYVDFALRSGIHLTFSPNGTYSHCWAPHADALRPLLERGQVQIINHTFNHPDLRRLDDGRIRAELERNEEWVNRTFGSTTRPYYRPPYGAHSQHIDGLAGELGYTRTVLWDGSYGDSEVITPQYLMSQAEKYLRPGVIMLGHANHPAVLGLFDQILELIRQRGLDPVTLDEMFGTSRATG